MVTFLTIILLCILPFGELLRVQLPNGVSIQALDGITLSIFLFTCFQAIKTKAYLAIPFVKPLIFFLCVCLFSLFVNSVRFPLGQISIGSLYLFRYTAYTSLYFFFFHTAKKRYETLSRWIIVSGVLVAVFGLLQYFFYPDLRNLYYAGWDEHYLRLFSTFFDPNFAGIYLVLNFIFTLDFFFKNIGKRNWNQIWPLSGILFLFFITILLTYSRSAFLALAVGLSFYLFPKGYKKFLPVFASAIFLFILFVIFFTSAPTEGAHLLRVPSSQARIDSARHAFTIIADDPVFGIGFDMYRYAQEQHHYLGQATWQVSHAGAGTDNSLLFILATTGIIGLSIFVYLQRAIIMYFFKKNTPYSALGIACLAALLTSSFFINGLFYPSLMAFMWMILGITASK